MERNRKYLNPRLRKLWRYDPETGNFHHLLRTWGYAGSILPGDIAGTLKDGYVQLGHDGKTYRAHILAWVWMKGELPPKGSDIDHRDRNRAHNKWTNLRLLGRGGNNLNHNGPRSDSTTGVRGVYRNRGGRAGTFFARITIDGKIVHLGTYDTIEEAAEARRRAEVKFWRVPVLEEAENA
jgi:hypothetical protein